MPLRINSRTSTAELSMALLLRLITFFSKMDNLAASSFRPAFMAASFSAFVTRFSAKAELKAAKLKAAIRSRCFMGYSIQFGLIKVRSLKECLNSVYRQTPSPRGWQQAILDYY